MSSAAAWFAIAVLQAQPAVPAASVEPPAPSAPVFEPYDGSLAQGLDEVRALSDAGKLEEAYALCGRLLAPTRFDAWRERQVAEPGVVKRVVEAATPAFDWLGVSGLFPEERAAVHYAEGIVASTAGDRAHAEPVFQSARSLAGPGELRLASIYNLGVNALLDGEEQRAKIPEIQGGQAAPQAAPPAAAPGAPGAPGAPPAPDPLDLARAAYLRAKTHFIERVRAAWDDADTRANIELVQRRLKELDEIQKKREEQKKKDEQEKQDEKDQKDKDEKKNPSDQKKDDEKEQQKKDDDSEKKDPNSEEKSENEKKDKEEPPKPEDAEKKDEKPEDQKAEEQKPQPSEETLEKLLTKEEMMRLLDVLKQHEEEYEKLKAQMRQARRAKVKKDW
jgi:hypothetical protein